MKTIKKIRKYLNNNQAIISGFALLIIPIAYWFKKNDLTTLQIVAETWQVYPVSFLFLIIAYNTRKIN